MAYIDAFFFNLVLANAVETPSRRPELDHFVDTLHNMLHFAGTMQTPLVSFMNGITCMRSIITFLPSNHTKLVFLFIC